MNIHSNSNGIDDETSKIEAFKILNPFVPNAPFLYPLKTSGYFQGVGKGCIGNELVKRTRGLTNTILTLNTMLDFLLSIGNFDLVKTLEPHLGKRLRNTRIINQYLYKHISPEQSQRQHQYCTLNRFKIDATKKSLKLL